MEWGSKERKDEKSQGKRRQHKDRGDKARN